MHMQIHMLGRKQSMQACKLRKANDSFGKGLDVLKAHVLKAHVLNCLMTGRCPHKSLQLRLNQNRFDFQKSATFKGLKSSPILYCVSFNPENGTFSKIKKSDTQTE